MKKQNENAIDYLRRMTYWLDNEEDSLLDSLPTIESIVNFFELWEIYDTDFASGIVEAIELGQDPKDWNDFIDKYKLTNWKKF